MDVVIPLQGMSDNEVGEIVHVAGRDGLVARLAELGLRPGCSVEMLRAGDPFLVRIGASTLSLRIDGHVDIQVRMGAG